MKYLVLFLIGSILVFAQEYEPIDTLDTVERTKAKQGFEKSQERFTQFVSANYSKKIAKEINRGTEYFRDDFIEQIEDGKFLYDERFTSKIKEILDEIRNANPSYKIESEFLISKETGLNAFCVYDGTMIVNLGAFYYLENEDELAGVIAHEIAHYILKHALENQIRSVEQEKKDRQNKTIKNLKNQKYNRNEKALNLFRERLYDAGKLNRKHEYQADSLGYALFRNTKYQKSDFLNAFKLIQLYDTIQPKGLEIETYIKLFHVDGIPFREKWMRKEDFSSYDYSKYKEKFEEDSLKTHPEADERIKYLQQLFPEVDSLKPPKEISQEFKDLQTIAEKEMVPNLYFDKNYGKAIYLAMLRIQKEKDVEFYKSWLGKLFQKVYDARKAYKLNRYVENIVPKEHSESYQQFLSFMWNLSLNDIKAIADYYSK